MKPVASHRSRIAHYTHRGDWRQLLRHWMLHDSLIALDAAIAVLNRGDAQLQQAGQALDLLCRKAEPKSAGTSAVRQAVRMCPVAAVIWLCRHYQAACFCSVEKPEQRRSVRAKLYRGVRAAQRAQRCPDVKSDPLLLARFRQLESMGWFRLQRWRQAERWIPTLLKTHRRAAAQQPKLFLRPLWISLELHGRLLEEAGSLPAASLVHQERIAVLRRLVRLRQPGAQLHLALALLRADSVARRNSNPETAFPLASDAVATIRKLVAREPQKHSFHLVTGLKTLGRLQLRQRFYREALANFRSAVTIMRRLARTDPGKYSLGLAQSLSALGKAEQAAGKYPRASQHLKESLEIRQMLWRTGQQIQRGHIASSLHDLALLSIKQEHYPEALGPLQNELRWWASSHQHSYYIRGQTAVALTTIGAVYVKLRKFRQAIARLREAEHLFAQACANASTAYLGNRRLCAMHLGFALMNHAGRRARENYIQARRAFRRSIRYGHLSREQLEGQAARRRQQRLMIRSYEGYAEASLKLWRHSPKPKLLGEVLQTLEASRAWLLRDTLAQESVRPRNAPTQLFQQFNSVRTRWFHVRQLLRSAQADQAALPDSSDAAPTQPPALIAPAASSFNFENQSLRGSRGGLARAQVGLARRYDCIVEKIRRFDPQFDPERLHVTGTGELERGLLSQYADTALIEFLVTETVGLALVSIRGHVTALPLDQFKSPRLAQLGDEWLKHCPRSQLYKDAPVKPRGEKANFNNWERHLPRILKSLQASVWNRLTDFLQTRNIKRIVVIPTRALQMLPLHACQLADGSYVSDCFEVIYLPGLTTLRIPPSAATKNLKTLLVYNPTQDLVFSEVEGRMLQKQINGRITSLRGEKATKGRLLQAAADCSCWHFSGHAHFDAEDPLNSALVLGLAALNFQPNWLTLREIFCCLRMSRAPVVIVNGCASARLIPDRADDPLSLTHGLLGAGARCVISTLWDVDDVSSALLMMKFHELWQYSDSHAALSPAAALREAQRWLRQDIRSGRELAHNIMPRYLERIEDKKLVETCQRCVLDYERRFPARPPFASPVYWATHTYNGFGFQPHNG